MKDLSYKTTQFGQYAFFALTLLFLGACAKDKPKEEEQKGTSYISFSFENQMMSAFRATTEDQYDGDKETVTNQDEYGIPEEQKIYNLWVLLYTKGSSDNDSYLEYKYRFTPNGLENVFDQENTYEDEDGKLHFGNDQVTLDNLHVYSSVKRVEPAQYKAVILVNTVFNLNNASFPQISSQTYNGETDIMDILADKTRWVPVAQKKNSTAKGSTLAELKAATNEVFLNLKEDYPICPEDLAKRHTDQNENRGVFSYYIDESFSVPNKGSKVKPFDKTVELKRWLSKIELYLTTTNEQGEVYHRTRGLQLQDVRLEHSFFVGKEKLFEWNTQANATPAQSEQDMTAQSLADYTKLKELIPFLKTISTQAFSHTTKYTKKLFYTHYIPAYLNGFEKQEITFTSPEKTTIQKDTRTLVHLVFRNTQTNEVFDYYVPLFNPDNMAKPSYIEAANWTKYTTLRNSIYRIYCVLQGPNRLNIEYELIPWDEKTIDLPAHE